MALSGILPYGQGPTLDWTFGDSMWFALENMPLIGDPIKTARGADSATVKVAAAYTAAHPEIPNPTLPDLETTAKAIGGGLQTVATILTYGAVAVACYYGYKIVKEIKS